MRVAQKSKTRVGLKYYYNTKTGEKYWRDKVLPELWALDRTGVRCFYASFADQSTYHLPSQSEKTYVNLQTGAREVNLADVFANTAAQPPAYDMHRELCV